MSGKVNKTNPGTAMAKISPISLAEGAAEAPQKMLYAGLGALAAVFAAKQLMGMFTKSRAEKETDLLDNGIHSEAQKGNRLSYLKAQYSQFADMIEEATDTSGTDEDTIYGVFEKMKNNADVLQLIKAYGSRYNFWFGVPLGKFDLTQILVSELTESERKHINAILAGKGITLTF